MLTPRVTHGTEKDDAHTDCNNWVEFSSACLAPFGGCILRLLVDASAATPAPAPYQKQTHKIQIQRLRTEQYNHQNTAKSKEHSNSHLQSMHCQVCTWTKP